TELEASAHTVVDIARTLVTERDDSVDTELVPWAEVVQKTIESHIRDLHEILPWARLVTGDAHSTHATSPGLSGRRAVVERLDVALPTLADLPAHCEVVLSEFANLRIGKITNSDDHEALACLDTLIESLEHSVVAAQALIRRLSSLSQLAKKIFEEMK